MQKGDVLGFMSESESSGIVYNFRPLGFGAKVRTRSFTSLPLIGGAYTFDAIAYDTWVFAFSAVIDPSKWVIRYIYVKIEINWKVIKFN